MTIIPKIIYKKSYYNFYPVTMDNIYEYLETKYALYYPKYFKGEIQFKLRRYRTIPMEVTDIFDVCHCYEDCVKRIKAHENIYEVFSDFDQYILFKLLHMGKLYKEIEMEYQQGNHLFLWFTNELLRIYRFKI